MHSSLTNSASSSKNALSFCYIEIGLLTICKFFHLKVYYGHIWKETVTCMTIITTEQSYGTNDIINRFLISIWQFIYKTTFQCTLFSSKKLLMAWHSYYRRLTCKSSNPNKAIYLFELLEQKSFWKCCQLKWRNGQWEINPLFLNKAARCSFTDKEATINADFA